MTKYRPIDFLKNLAFRFNDDDIPALGSQLAYSLLLAFFPFLIFLMTVVGFSPIKNQEVLTGLRTIMPRNAFELIEKTIIEIMNTKNSHLLSVSIIASIWTASNGFAAVIKGLNKAYDESEHRSFFKVQFIAIIFTLELILIIILSFFLIVFGNLFKDFISKQFRVNWTLLVHFIWYLIKYLIIFLSMLLIFCSLYHYTPCRKLSWKEVIPGSIFTTLGWILTSIIFSFYVNNFTNYSKIYGSIGAIIVLMTWLFLSSIIILLGGEINAVLAYDKKVNGHIKK